LIKPPQLVIQEPNNIQFHNPSLTYLERWIKYYPERDRFATPPLRGRWEGVSAHQESRRPHLNPPLRGEEEVSILNLFQCC
jgi:hypothetical protein